MDLAFIFKTFRSRGYTLEHSIAELADNSITHNAKNIWTYMYWSDDSGKNSFIMVIDDGDGGVVGTKPQKPLCSFFISFINNK